MAEHYDSLLGWDKCHDTPYNERPRTVSYGKPLISTFGDSYTYCSDVGDEETWQTYLSELMKGDVYNFATPGYGTDQAYLKYRSISRRISTPIVILGITTENINRIVNVYRPFYMEKTGIRLPKPRFELDNGKLTLVENPIKNACDIEKLKDERFIQKLGEKDWWYNRNNCPICQFPYLKILLNRRIWLEAFYGKKKRRISDADPRPWEDLWKYQENRDLMFEIIDSFAKEARESGAVPIIMILPMQDQVFEKFITKKDPACVSMILDHCRQKGYLCFNCVDALSRSVATREEIVLLYIVHLSAKGNRIVASELFKFIETHVSSM